MTWPERGRFIHGGMATRPEASVVSMGGGVHEDGGRDPRAGRLLGGGAERSESDSCVRTNLGVTGSELDGLESRSYLKLNKK